jgi:hypothetical protein
VTHLAHFPAPAQGGVYEGFVFFTKPERLIYAPSAGPSAIH